MIIKSALQKLLKGILHTQKRKIHTNRENKKE
jgi:hypothetical protein